LAQLSPRRAFAIGLMRAKRQSRKELHQMALDYDTALAGLQDEFDQLASAHYKQCYAAAVDEARIERAAMRPGTLLH
jgi:hypothetical protein